MESGKWCLCLYPETEQSFDKKLKNSTFRSWDVEAAKKAAHCMEQTSSFPLSFAFPKQSQAESALVRTGKPFVHE